MTSIADGECPSSSTPASSSSSSSGDDSDDEEYIGDEDQREKKIDEEQGNEKVKGSSKRKRGRTKTEKKSHPCPICQRCFPFPNKVREHILTHKENRYVCQECTVEHKFDTILELRAHCKEVHSKARHKCELCSYTNEKPAFVRKHFKLNHIDGVPCTILGCTLKVARNRLKTHILECHSSTAPSIFPTAPIRTSGPRLQKCFQCNYLPDPSITDSERRHYDLEKHIQIIHENRGRVECSFGCGHLVKIAQLSAHMRKIHPDVSLSGGSSLTPSLREDTNTMTSLASEDVIDLSDRELSDLEELREPVKKKPRGIGIFDCKTCGSRFKDMYNLKRHVMRVHEKAYKPRVTQKTFQCSRKAMNASEGTSEGPPEDLCGKTFKTEQALIDHYNVHDDVRPYGCVTCDRRFHARDRFAVHLMKYHQTSIKDINANSADFGEFRRDSEDIPRKIMESTSTSEDVAPEVSKSVEPSENVAKPPEAPEGPLTSEVTPDDVELPEAPPEDVEAPEAPPEDVEAPEEPPSEESIPEEEDLQMGKF